MAGSNERNIIICTGQSGIKVKDCLNRINGELDTPREIISLEEEIQNFTSRELVHFLQLPRSVMIKQWKTVAEKSVNTILSDYKDYFFTFHAAYYHQKTRGLIPAVDLKTLVKLRDKVKLVIVFIDDVYDVYRRLLMEEEMFYGVRSLTSAGAIFSSIFNLVTLLNWRESEIAFTRSISDFLNAPMFVIATKHPLLIAKRLVMEPLESLKLYYLSHPITSVREKAKTFLSDFVGRLAQLKEEFLRDKNSILFMPTTIDELIIKREPNGEEGTYQYTPEFYQRWSIFNENNTISPALPSQAQNINPLNPQNHTIQAELSNTLSILLDHLWNHIYRQVIFRDYCLVEQSKNGIIVIRPFYKGYRSSGSIGELKHNLLLSVSGETDRFTYVYSCREDVLISSIIKLFKEIELRLSAKCKVDLNTVRDEWVADAEYYCRLNNKEMIERIVPHLPSGYDFTDGNPSDWEGDELSQRADRREKAFREAINIMKLDAIDKQIETHLNIKSRIIYEIFNEEIFFSETNKYLKSLN